MFDVEEEFVRYNEQGIKELLEYLREKGYEISLWGAGRRSKSLLRLFDKQKKYIQLVYDSDSVKHGSEFEGRLVSAYKENEADVIIMPNLAWAQEIFPLLEKYNSTPNLVFLDDVVFGNMTPDNLLDLPINKEIESYSPSSDMFFCALFILYYPDSNFIDNINKIINEFKKIYIYDNSEINDQAFISQLETYPSIQYMSFCENKGLGHPINYVSQLAIDEGFSWIMTFDQDSIPVDNMIEIMRNYVSFITEFNSDVAIFAPRTCFPNEVIEDSRLMPAINFLHTTIQSGSLLNLTVLSSLGGYNEDLFIDEVDHEYCIRCLLSGYKIIRINSAKLLHQTNDLSNEYIIVDRRKFILNKYGADRYYYHYRNCLYGVMKYFWADRLYAAYCQRALEKCKIFVNCEKESEFLKSAICQAEIDFRLGITGRRKHMENNVLGAEVSKERKIIIYGVGRRYKYLFKSPSWWIAYFISQDVKVVAVLDKKFSDTSALYDFGYKVCAYSPEKMPKDIAFDCVVILPKEYYSTIREEIIKNDICNVNRIMLWDNFIMPQVCRILHVELFVGLKGVEIGGPTGIFSLIYSVAKKCDGVNFSVDTVWRDNSSQDYVYNEKSIGRMIIAEATDLKVLSNQSYDFVLSSNNLEHVANPMKAIFEFKRITRLGGYILVLVPNKYYSFDHCRPYTSYQHIYDDYKSNVSEYDMSHLPEIEKLHDYDMDIGCGGEERFLTRAKKNFENRCLHHHVFSQEVLKKMFEFMGIEIVDQFEIDSNFGVLGKVINKDVIGE